MLRYWSDTFHLLTRNILRVASVSEHRPHGRLITPLHQKHKPVYLRFDNRPLASLGIAFHVKRVDPTGCM